jgi:hypothetical protein
MKVVKQISTGKLVHGESPDFLPGNGIKNAVFFSKLDPRDLEEIEVSPTEWASANKKPAIASNTQLLEKILEIAQEGKSGKKKTLEDLKVEIVGAVEPVKIGD